MFSLQEQFTVLASLLVCVMQTKIGVRSLITCDLVSGFHQGKCSPIDYWNQNF